MVNRRVGLRQRVGLGTGHAGRPERAGRDPLEGEASLLELTPSATGLANRAQLRPGRAAGAGDNNAAPRRTAGPFLALSGHAPGDDALPGCHPRTTAGWRQNRGPALLTSGRVIARPAVAR